jgi:hypothetical protein
LCYSRWEDGFSAATSKVGDILVHIRGGFIPAVLRRKEGERRRAVMVGTCDVLYQKGVYSGADWEDWLLE